MAESPQAENPLQVVLRETEPLDHPLGERLPLYVWAALDVPGGDGQIEDTLKELDRRGIAACATWRPGPERQASLAKALRIARLQNELGLRVNVNANACTYRVFDGSEDTAHVGDDGRPFFDTSSSARVKLGCPFAVRQRYSEMREQIAYFVRGYSDANMPVDFVFADWEIDGPIEWNDGWAAARRCARCREHIADIDSFGAVQTAFRRARAEITHKCYVEPILEAYPRALVGNYGVYPNDGWRYWYDYFEREPAAAAVGARRDRRAVYRPWPQDEFERSGYTFAMPVVYTRHDIWTWYDWENSDFRWVYNLLLQTSSAGMHTPARVRIVSFVNYRSCSKPKSPDDPVRPLSREAYKELLWHMLLRRHDAFFLWCPLQDTATEIRPLHEVFSESLRYREFLDHGTPVSFEVPCEPGPVVSALRRGSRVLVRRTDFTDDSRPTVLDAGGVKIEVPRTPGRCLVVDLGEPCGGGPGGSRAPSEAR